MTLDEAIRDAYESGLADPGEIALYVIEHADRRWLGKALIEEAPELIRHRARMLNHFARARVDRAVPDGEDEERRTWEPCEFAPEFGWKPRRLLTAEDCLLIAAYRRSQADAIMAQADEWEARAVRIREAGVDVLGELPDLVEAAA